MILRCHYGPTMEWPSAQSHDRKPPVMSARGDKIQHAGVGSLKGRHGFTLIELLVVVGCIRQWLISMNEFPFTGR